MNRYSEQLNPYIRAIQRSFLYVLLGAVLASVLVYAFMQSVEPTYEVHTSYLVSLATREKAEEYRFDGFYALQATDLFTATLARWMQTPETIVAAHTEANITIPTSTPRELVKTVTAEKSAPQLVSVTVRHTQKEEAEALAQALETVMKNNVEQYHQEGIPELQFTVVTTEPWTGVSEPAVPLVTLATFLLVLFVGINIVLLLETIRNGEGLATRTNL